MEPALLLTRPGQGSQRVLAATEQMLGRSVDHMISPLIRIEPLEAQAPQGVIAVLTSEQGARRAADLGATGLAYCVGDRTAAVARSLGFRARSAAGNVSALIRMIETEQPTVPLLHFRGEHSTGALSDQLNAAGFDTGELVVYRQTARPLSPDAMALLGADRPVVVPLFSPRSAELFVQAVAAPGAPLRPVAISQSAADRLPWPARIAASPDLPSMISAICQELSPLGAR